MKKISHVQSKCVFNIVISREYAKKENKTKVKENSENIKEDKEDNINTSTGMLSSFYVSDIDRIWQKIQDKDSIVRYIEALNTPVTNRIEIDKNVSQMKKWLSPDKYPLGKWPSIYSPSLMQQIAINMGISDEKQLSKFFSINGPPGTGKTTLLKEIISSYVVERAILLSNYKNPDDAFTRCNFDCPENEYLKYYYIPADELKKYGIIVASNNNAAVENISKELPIAKDVKKSNTNLFNIDKNTEIYFSDIAKALMDNGEECWGLISASLGKKSNINKFKQTIWFNKDCVNLQQRYKGELPDWEQAKDKFKNKYQEVLKYRMHIQKAMENTNMHDSLIQEYENAKNEIDIAKSQITEIQELFSQRKKEQEDLNNQIEVLKENAALLNKKVGFSKKLFSFLFKKDSVVLELNSIRKKIRDTTDELAQCNVLLSDLQKLKDTAENNLEKANSNFAEKEKTLSINCEQMKKYKEEFGRNFADEKFWENIQKNESSQIACPWTNKDYDTLREELFYYGLMLHKAFVLNSKRVKQNMNCLINMWNDNFPKKDKKAGYKHLLNTLFLIVPVISTTFASVSTFLENIDKNELGTLIIDEAGQATPYSALGAIWRTSKAIIVGDPLQVEPVVTVPKELSRKFAEEFGIASAYSSQELSVQRLADSINPYGGYSEYNDEKIWLGCPLVIHRRCIDPMFSISNEIAYNNRMFKKTIEPKENILLSLKKSTWIDIKGKENGNKDHFVPAQGKKVIELVINAFNLQNSFPSLYVISPFKSVANNIKISLKKALYENYPNYNHKDIDDWIGKSCGTIHTFQGKEANEVIIILGCDEKSGEGAAQWAGKNPNILNVAVTRAKYRVAVIGDTDLWRKVPNFDLAYKILCKDFI
ncbi:MAG: AAA domain-containing protein [Clostridia bacterium]|jgi:ferredoxin-thioredoxin reductase catalytic subunit|nr:AAA domain-containing protein [Clostridia bacterium]